MSDLSRPWADDSRFKGGAVACDVGLPMALVPRSGRRKDGKTVPDIDLQTAEVALAAAKQKAADLGTKMDIAIVDSGANLKAFARMDDAWLGSVDISMRKARTARYFDMPSGDIGTLSQPGGPLFNIEHSNGGLISFPGGVLLRNKAGDIIGAIGVSGSSVENDDAVARAGAAAIA
jgi:uncharacterized protein GlcG (DUF336 family)